MTAALIGFAAVLVLAFLRMPLGVALGLVGVVGFAELANFKAAMSSAARLVIDSGQSYGLSVVPLFIMMGLMVNVVVWQKSCIALRLFFWAIKKVDLPCPLSVHAACSQPSADHLWRRPPRCPKFQCLKCDATNTAIP